MLIIQTLLNITVALILSLNRPVATKATPSTNKVLAQATYSLSNRYSNSYVNDVFADNILLTLAYMSGKVKSVSEISWDKIKAPGTSTVTLKPGQTFAFHDAVADKYTNKVVATTNAHFDSTQGFKSDGWLVGDGVCHLASFMYVVSKDAGLVSEAPTRHDFAQIPDVEKQNGVSIYYSPDNKNSSTYQNLYITNNYNKTIAFVFTQKNSALNIKVEQLN